MIEYIATKELIELAVVVVVTLGLVKILPTRWFSREEKFRYESRVRLKKKLR